MAWLNLMFSRNLPLPVGGGASRVRLLALAICLGSALGTCRAADGGPAFEVASVKLSAPMNALEEMARNGLWENVLSVGRFRAPGSGRRFEMLGATLAQLAALAYEVRPRTVVGPSWISDARFDVVATIPSGHSREKCPEMLRTLLEERFALRAHRDVRTTSGYVLSVRKGGAKLQEAGPLAPTADTASLLNRPRPRSPSGSVYELGHADMAQLTDLLAQNLRVPVEDQTELKGVYAITLRIPAGESPDSSDRAAQFEEALSELGLRLAPGKVQTPILVIDSASKTPTEN